MKALLKLALYLSGLVIVLIVAAGLWVVTLDPNDHKDWISNKVQEETGRSLALDGDINVSLYPRLGIELNNVTLGNAPGFGDEPFFHADYLNFRIKTVPLMQEVYEIDTASIRGAVINLARNEQGANWDDFASAEEQEPSSGFAVAAIAFGGLDIQDAEINWIEETTDTRYRLDNITINTGELVYGEPVAVSLALHAVANKPALSGNIQLKTTITYDIDNGPYTVADLDVTGTMNGENIPGGSTALSLSSTVEVNLEDDVATVSDLQFSILGVEATGNIRVSKLQSPVPSFQTTLAAKGDDLARLFKIVAIEPLASRLASLPERGFTLHTSLDADMERGDIYVSQFSTSILGAEINAEIKAHNIRSETPEFRGALQATGPDLPALLQVAGQFAGKDSPLSQYGKQLAAVDKKTFAVKTDFDVDMKSGDIDMPVLSVKTLGIDIAGKLKAKDMQSKSGSVNGQFSVKGTRLTQVLRAIDQKDLAGVLRSVDFATGVSGTFNNLQLQPLTLDAVFAGKQSPDAPLTLSLNAATNIDLEAGKLNLNKLDIKGSGLNVTGKLNIDKFQSEQNFSGAVNIAPFNLRKLLRQLNQEVPITADKKALSKVALNTRFSGSKKALNVSQFDVMLDEAKLQARFTLNDYAKPAWRFGIEIDQMNVDRYLPPQAKDKKKRPVTPEVAAGAAAQLPVELLRSLDVKGDVKIGKLTISGAQLSDIVLALNGKDGNIKMHPITANLYQGKYSGNISLHASGKLPRITIDSSLLDIQVEPLLHDVTGAAKLRGRGDFSAALIATGANTDAMKKTLNGQMSFKFQDGAIKGFNLGKIMRLGKSLKDNFKLRVSERETTDLSELSGNPVAENGVIRLDDLKGSAPGLRLSGKGVLANLPKNNLNYQISASIVATSTGQGGRRLEQGKLEGLPLECTFKGPLDNPKRTCDASKLLAAFAKKLLKGFIGLPDNATPGEADNDARTDAAEEDPAKKLKQGLDILKDIFGR